MDRKLSILLNDNFHQSTINGRVLPHPSQMRDYATKFSMEEANSIFLSISKEILPLLLEQKLIPRRLKIAFDFHTQLYYGRKDNPHVIGILAEKGTKKAHKWHIQVNIFIQHKGGFLLIQFNRVPHSIV